MADFVAFPSKFLDLYKIDVFSSVLRKAAERIDNGGGVALERNDDVVDQLFSSWMKHKGSLNARYDPKSSLASSEQEWRVLAIAIIKEAMEELFILCCKSGFIKRAVLRTETTADIELRTCSAYPKEYFGLTLAYRGYRFYRSRLNRGPVTRLVGDRLDREWLESICEKAHSSENDARGAFRLLVSSD